MLLFRVESNKSHGGAVVHDEDESTTINTHLTLEDEFTLTRIKNRAYELEKGDRDQFLWSVVFRLVCRERAYRSVMSEIGLSIDTNVRIFEEDGPAE